MATSPKKFFLKIFVKNMFIGVILCEKSIARIPEAWKRFLDPDSGKMVGGNFFQFFPYF